MEQRTVRVGIDVGGTHTKAVAIDNATHEIIGKSSVKTTHDSNLGVAEGVVQAFKNCLFENNIKPEYECFEIGHLDTVLNMAAKGLVPGAPMQFNFVLGVNGCTPATLGNLDYLVNKIPAGSTWTVTGVGRGAWPMAAAGIVMGGNVRVGFEDNIYLERGHKAASNGELVAKVVALAKLLGREVATPDEARRILSLTK